MEFRGLFVLFVVGVTISCVQGFPRDSSVVKNEEVIRVDDSSVAATAKDKVDEVQTTTENSLLPENIHVTIDTNEIITPHIVSCKHEEVTDDLVCQEHCLPKGYSYGLCVNYKCSCI